MTWCTILGNYILRIRYNYKKLFFVQIVVNFDDAVYKAATRMTTSTFGTCIGMVSDGTPTTTGLTTTSTLATPRSLQLI